MGDPPVTPPPPRRRRGHHTWPQRAVLLVNVFVVATCLIVAVAVFWFNRRVSDRQVVVLDTTPAATTLPTPPTTPGTGASTPGDAPEDVTTTTAADEWGAYEGDTSARNFLITGQSANPCVDPDDPTAGGFGAGNTDGHLTDSIMVMRISPATNQAAVLSFPRDLWVKIHGRNGSGRINSAYDPTDPNRLVGTISDNFGITIDHFINLDLCMFKTLVDAVDGVNVPFQYRVWDRNVGLDIPEPGCVALDGNQALAWVRTRKLRYIDENGKEQQDKSSDFGRISRQQDFLRRLATKAISNGLTKPSKATTFLNSYLDFVTTDSGLTVGKALDFVSAMRNIDPAAIRTYQLETVSEPHNGLSTLGKKKSAFNDQVLAVFQGKADLATISTGAPELAPEDTAVAGATVTDPTAPPAVTDSTLPVVDLESNLQGIVPPDDPSCVP